jgi:hypothetical protein
MAPTSTRTAGLFAAIIPSPSESAPKPSRGQRMRDPAATLRRRGPQRGGDDPDPQPVTASAAARATSAVFTAARTVVPWLHQLLCVPPVG